MSDLGQDLKNYVKMGVKAIGDTASKIGENTKQLVNKLSVEGRKQEILNDFGAKAYEMWKNGTEFPEELTEGFREVLELDEQLKQFEAAEEAPCDQAANCEQAASCPGPEACGAAFRPEKEKDDVPVIEVKPEDKEERNESPLSSAINALFEQKPQVDQMAEKVNSSLDEMGEQLRKFSSDLGKQISDLADELMDHDKKD